MATLIRSSAVVFLIFALAVSGVAQQPVPTSHSANHQQMVSKAIEFLKTRQNKDGSYYTAAGPGVTALVTAGVLRHGRSPEDPLVSRSLKYLEALVQPSGGIHRPETLYRNYETCLAMMCFAEANQDGRMTNCWSGPKSS